MSAMHLIKLLQFAVDNFRVHMKHPQQHHNNEAFFSQAIKLCLR